MTRKLAEAGVDPDNLANLLDEGQDYESLGFPTQGLAAHLSREGVLKNMGKSTANGRRRTLWGKGTYFSVWKGYYLDNRTHLRAHFGLPIEGNQQAASPKIPAVS